MPGLDLRDSRGRERVSLCLSDVGPLLAFDAEGNDALLLGVDDPGTAGRAERLDIRQARAELAARRLAEGA